MSHCYNCKHWRLTVPNMGGIVDMGICALYAEKREEEDSCGRWVEQTSDDRAVQIAVRRMINEHCSEHCKDVRDTALESFKNDMRSRILKIFDLEESIDD